MSHPFTTEDLEALAGGYLDPSRGGALETHIETCDECAEELSWLRVELDAFASRDAGMDDAHLSQLWQGVSDQIEDHNPSRSDAPIPLSSARRSPARRAAWFGAGFSVAAVAAAVMVFVIRPPAPSPSKDTATATTPTTATPVAASPGDKNRTKALAAIAEAEAAYSRAIQSLEAEYVAKRDQLDPQVAAAHEATFAKNRALLSEAKNQAGDDIEGQMLSLDAYAHHVRTLQDVVDAVE